jgi:threonine dehydratase
VPLSVESIDRAAREIDPVFLHSPQFQADALGDALGVRVVVKVESVNPIRSFKGRGADFFAQHVSDPAQPLVCASAGNFGQGLAWTARKHGLTCEVFAATSANELKVERMRALGARVQLAGRDFDAAKTEARAHAERVGARFVEDGREPAIAEGAGTIAVELSAWPERFDSVIVPLGNGALLGGVATWIKAVAPETQLIGVCAARAPAMERSWRAGRAIETTDADTMADGIAVRVPVPQALETLHGVVDDIALVTEESLRDACRLVSATVGVLSEPAGAAGVAALLQYRGRWSRGVVATVLCGSNVSGDFL